MGSRGERHTSIFFDFFAFQNRAQGSGRVFSTPPHLGVHDLLILLRGLFTTSASSSLWWPGGGESRRVIKSRKRGGMADERDTVDFHFCQRV